MRILLKKLLLLIIPFLFASSAVLAQETEVIRLSEPVQVTSAYEVFGAEVNEWDEAVSLSEVIKGMDKFSDGELEEGVIEIEPITLEAEVAEVCAKKGCFFVAKDGEFTARVTFKDYSFFIPADSQGKKVKLKGVFSLKKLSEEQAKHYAEDSGKAPDAVTGPQVEYSIVAASVLIPKG